MSPQKSPTAPRALSFSPSLKLGVKWLLGKMKAHPHVHSGQNKYTRSHPVTSRPTRLPANQRPAEVRSPTSLPLCLPVCPSASLCISLTLNLSACLPVSLSVSMSGVSINLSAWEAARFKPQHRRG